MPALAQIRRIQGKVVDEEGQPVAGAAIEVTIASLADVPTSPCEHNDQTWRAQTNATGDYIVTVPGAGEYVVTAAKEGIGSDRTKVAAAAKRPRHREPDAVEAGAGPSSPLANCGTTTFDRRVKRSRSRAAAADPGLARLLEVARGRAPAYARLRRSAGDRSRRLGAARSRSAAARRQRAREVSAKSGDGRAETGAGVAARSGDLLHLRSPVYVRRSQAALLR